MKYASTFLSHSSSDKPLVEAVANELGRRGIVTWLDKNEPTAGQNLCEVFAAAIERQATVCVFLSEAAVKSEWVKDELAIALRKVKESGRIIPIYLGDPLALVKSHPLLKSRWLHPNGDRVTQFGICPIEGADESAKARAIADKVAQGIYADLRIANQNEVILYLDQRGKGNRCGEPNDIPENVAKQEAPALVFRPDMGKRSSTEVLRGDEWNNRWSDMKWALGQSIGNCRGGDPKTIRILGNAQLGLPFFLGHYFNRNTSTHLYCYNMDGSVFSNQGQERHAPLTGGDAHCVAAHPGVTPIPSGDRQEAISLLLVTENYVQTIVDYLKANSATYPKYGYWVAHGQFTDNNQVMDYITDIVALLLRLKRDGVRTIYLFSSLPFNVLPLLGANLLHVVNVVFMEYRKDLQGKKAGVGKMYVPLPNEK